MTEAAWRSLYVSFTYKHASLIYTSLSRPKAVHISGCTVLMSLAQSPLGGLGLFNSNRTICRQTNLVKRLIKNLQYVSATNVIRCGLH